MPAAGKTTVARALADELALPVVSKDDIKEQLYEALGVGDVEWSQRLGGASYALIFVLAAELLGAGQAVILDANFFADRHEERFRELPPHRVAQVHCHAPLDVLLDRFNGRGERHSGHLDRQRSVELAGRFESAVHRPLALDGELLRVDTTGYVDLPRLAARIGELLPDGARASVRRP